MGGGRGSTEVAWTLCFAVLCRLQLPCVALCEEFNEISPLPTPKDQPLSFRDCQSGVETAR